MLVIRKNSASSYSNALGDAFSGCGIKHPTNKAAREACQAEWNRRYADSTELERIRLQNEALALQNAAQSQPMSAGSILLITGGSIAALAVLIIVVKKYGK
jgi:hypothetical protein